MYVFSLTLTISLYKHTSRRNVLGNFEIEITTVYQHTDHQGCRTGLCCICSCEVNSLGGTSEFTSPLHVHWRKIEIFFCVPFRPSFTVFGDSPFPRTKIFWSAGVSRTFTILFFPFPKRTHLKITKREGSIQMSSPWWRTQTGPVLSLTRRGCRCYSSVIHT